MVSPKTSNVVEAHAPGTKDKLPGLPVYSARAIVPDVPLTDILCVFAVAINVYHTSSSIPAALQVGAVSGDWVVWT